MIMRRKIPLLLLFLLIATVAMLAPIESGAAGPDRISYQGSLTDSAGTAIPDDTYKMRFTMFDQLTGGAQAWQETQNAVDVTGGLFSTQLGSVTPLTTDIFSSPTLYLEVEVDADGNTTIESDEKYAPRQLIAAAAYAFQSDRATTAAEALKLGGLSSAQFLRSDDDDEASGRILFSANPSGDTITKAGVIIYPSSDTGEVNLFSVIDPASSAFFTVSGQDGIHNPGVTTNAVLQAGTSTYPEDYSRFGASTATSGEIADNQDLLVSDDLEVGGDLYLGGTKVVPPRAAGSGDAGFQSTSATYVSVDSVTINVPDDGYVYVHGSGYSGYWDGNWDGWVAVSMDGTTAATYSERHMDFTADPDFEVFSSSWLFSATAGSHTFHLLAKRSGGAGQVWIPRSSLTAIYIDLSGTGTAAAGMAPPPPAVLPPEADGPR